MKYGLLKRQDIFFVEKGEGRQDHPASINRKRESGPKEKIGRKGFSLPEMMLSLLILSLVSMVMATGIPSAAEALSRAVDAAHAQVLLSTTMTSIRNELTTANEVSANEAGTAIVYKDGSGRYNRIYKGLKDTGEEVDEDATDTADTTDTTETSDSESEEEEELWIWIKTIKKQLSPTEETAWKAASEEDQWAGTTYPTYDRLLISRSASTSNLHITYGEIPPVDPDDGIVSFEGLCVMKNNSPLAEYADLTFNVRLLGTAEDNEEDAEEDAEDSEESGEENSGEENSGG